MPRSAGGLPASQQCFSLTSFQHQSPISQQYFSLITDQRQPSATSQPNEAIIYYSPYFAYFYWIKKYYLYSAQMGFVNKCLNIVILTHQQVPYTSHRCRACSKLRLYQGINLSAFIGGPRLPRPKRVQQGGIFF
jgi:hypothetical protein